MYSIVYMYAYMYLCLFTASTELYSIVLKEPCTMYLLLLIRSIGQQGSLILNQSWAQVIFINALASICYIVSCVMRKREVFPASLFCVY